MRAFKSPMGMDFRALPLPATVVRLLLAVAAFTLTAVIWLGAAQASHSHAPDVIRMAADESVMHVILAPVVIVGHRDGTAGRATTAAARVASADCANVTASVAGNSNPIRVTLQ
jgi:uncharacterized Fe-S cluster-containing radical SAM superfamily enzyme